MLTITQAKDAYELAKSRAQTAMKDFETASRNLEAAQERYQEAIRAEHKLKPKQLPFGNPLLLHWLQKP